jgi:cysteine desulfurase
MKRSVPDVSGYFDYAASAPPFEAALEAQRAVGARFFANPSSLHAAGRAARAELDRLREAFSALCGFSGGRLVFTSGATEANNEVVHGVMSSSPAAARVVVLPDAHASVWNACRRYGDRLDTLPLSPDGRVRLADLAERLTPETRLVCCSHVASETGVIQDVAAIASLCERRGVACLVDGAQALGHVPVDLSVVTPDFYVFSAHKFGGPRGCGGFFLRAGTLSPLMDGGAQEWGLRPGTENMAAVAGAVVALQTSLETQTQEGERLRGLARELVRQLRNSGVRMEINGDPETGRPGFVSVSFLGVDGQALVADLSVQGYAVATGSACSENRPEPSRVILSLGRAPDYAMGTIRITLGRLTGPERVQMFARTVSATVRRHQGES